MAFVLLPPPLFTLFPFFIDGSPHRCVATNFSSSHRAKSVKRLSRSRRLPSVDNTIGRVINTRHTPNKLSSKDSSWNSSYLDETESLRWCNPERGKRGIVAIFRGTGKSKGRKRVNNRETSERISFECAFKSSHRIAERGGLDGRVEVKRHITAKGEVDESFGRTEALDGVELSNSIANISPPMNGTSRGNRDERSL